MQLIILNLGTTPFAKNTVFFFKLKKQFKEINGLFRQIKDLFQFEAIFKLSLNLTQIVTMI